MKSYKLFSDWIPEIILLLQTLLYWFYSSPLNPIAITMALVLILQFIFKNRISGFVVSVLFLFFNLSMCLALASELSEFPSRTESAMRMLLFGGMMMGTGVIASAIMLVKWGKRLSASVRVR